MSVIIGATQDRRREYIPSWGLWIPIAWLVLTIARPVNYWLNPAPIGGLVNDNIDDIYNSAVNRNVLIVLMTLGLIILARRRIGWSSWLKNNRILLALFIYMGISILWSDFIGVSFKRWFRAIGDLMMTLIVLTEKHPDEAIQCVLRRSAIILIVLSVILINFFPQLGVKAFSGTGASWVGVTSHKNQLGILTCVSAVFLVWSLFTNKVKSNGKNLIDIAVLLMALWLLFGFGIPTGGTSMTSKVIFVISCLFLWALGKFRILVPEILNRLVIVIFFSSALFFLIGEAFIVDILSKDVLTPLGRDVTLTGRTDLWKELVAIGNMHPILGSGYGGFWVEGNHKLDLLWERFPWTPNQAHNGYLEVYISLGIAGLVLLVGLISSVYKKIMSLLARDIGFGRFRITLFFMILIYNLTESSMTRPTNFLWFLFLILAVDPPVLSLQAKNIGDDTRGDFRASRK